MVLITFTFKIMRESKAKEKARDGGIQRTAIFYSYTFNNKFCELGEASPPSLT